MPVSKSSLKLGKTPQANALQTQLMLRLGYAFQNIALLQQALTHRSVSAKTNYERLEFLGDALLGAIVGEELYKRYPDEKEGRLTRLRATLVRQESLAMIASQLNIGAALILGAGESKSGGHHRESILADVLEAIIAAIYMDCGSYGQTQQVVCQWLHGLFTHVQPSETLKDPKTRLQEWLQAKKMPVPQYVLLEVTGDAPKQHFKSQCVIENLKLTTMGEGASRRFAEQQAAEQMLQLVHNIDAQKISNTKSKHRS